MITTIENLSILVHCDFQWSICLFSSISFTCWLSVFAVVPSLSHIIWVCMWSRICDADKMGIKPKRSTDGEKNDKKVESLRGNKTKTKAKPNQKKNSIECGHAVYGLFVVAVGAFISPVTSIAPPPPLRHQCHNRHHLPSFPPISMR